MKTNITQAEPDFAPVKLEITFENKRELMVFAAIFNAGGFIDKVRKMCPSIYDAELWRKASVLDNEMLSKTTQELKNNVWPNP